ncbi:hypothetical protein CLCR_09191 [Cladophialophora carrionii]|uniref:Uncharacterized protein n=1 Tax=Cladophialophora carrionii TaxID=86049 RepID=A0A1C1CRW2_9EURO|nr:hypothetical protein CLCR_09191 [Cladophialophora carrionii]
MSNFSVSSWSPACGPPVPEVTAAAFCGFTQAWVGKSTSADGQFCDQCCVLLNDGCDSWDGSRAPNHAPAAIRARALIAKAEVGDRVTTSSVCGRMSKARVDEERDDKDKSTDVVMGNATDRESSAEVERADGSEADVLCAEEAHESALSVMVISMMSAAGVGPPRRLLDCWFTCM